MEVEPEMNHRSSPMTARRKTRLVVRSGRMSSVVVVVVPELSESVIWREREKRSCGGAKRAKVPVPVLGVES